MALEPKIDGSSLVTQAVQMTLKVLRQQRDDKQQQNLADTYDFNPQIFQYGVHYVAGPIIFKNPFQITPSITFGATTQKVVEDTTIANHPIATGFIPLIIYPYVYGFTQSSGLINGFYLGLFAMTPVPTSATKYTISWNAKGKGSAYPQHRTDEAWNSAYNRNEPNYMTNQTKQSDIQ